MGEISAGVESWAVLAGIVTTMLGVIALPVTKRWLSEDVRSLLTVASAIVACLATFTATALALSFQLWQIAAVLGIGVVIAVLVVAATHALLHWRPWSLPLAWGLVWLALAVTGCGLLNQIGARFGWSFALVGWSALLMHYVYATSDREPAPASEDSRDSADEG